MFRISTAGRLALPIFASTGEGYHALVVGISGKGRRYEPAHVTPRVRVLSAAQSARVAKVSPRAENLPLETILAVRPRGMSEAVAKAHAEVLLAAGFSLNSNDPNCWLWECLVPDTAVCHELCYVGAVVQGSEEVVQVKAASADLLTEAPRMFEDALAELESYFQGEGLEHLSAILAGFKLNEQKWHQGQGFSQAGPI